MRLQRADFIAVLRKKIFVAVRTLKAEIIEFNVKTYSIVFRFREKHYFLYLESFLKMLSNN